MSKLPGWLGQVGAELSRLSERLDERRAETEADDPLLGGTDPVDSGKDEAAHVDQVPAPPTYAPTVAARPDPVAAIP